MCCKRFTIIVISLFTLLGISQGTVPDLVNFQGLLSDESGQPLSSGNYTVSFSFYDQLTGGTLVWGPQVFDGTAGTGHGAQLAIVDGYFNVILGPKDTADRSILDAFDQSNRFMEIVVNGTLTITPRQQILSTPYSISAGNAGSSSSDGSSLSFLKANYLDLQNAVELGLQPDYSSMNFGADIFVDADGYRNTVNTSTSTTTYSEETQAYINANGAGTPIANATETSTTSSTWVTAKFINCSNVYVSNVDNEILNQGGSETRCRIQFFYEDSSFEYSEVAITTATSYEAKSYANPNPLKRVGSIVVQLLTENSGHTAFEQSDLIHTSLYNGTKTVVTNTILDLSGTPTTLAFYAQKTMVGNGAITLTEISGDGGSTFQLTGLNAVDGETIDISSLTGTELALKFEISGDDIVYFEGFSFSGPSSSEGVSVTDIDPAWKRRICYIKHITTEGGGINTVGTWETRELNTLEGDTSFVTLNANQFVLQPGTYEIYASTPAQHTTRHHCCLFDVTQAAIVSIGTSAYSGSTLNVQTRSELWHQFTIEGTTTFEIRHKNGIEGSLGVSVEWGDNLYTMVRVEKLN